MAKLTVRIPNFSCLNVIKMSTRLTRRKDFPEQVKYPWILLRNGRLAEMIILDRQIKSSLAGFLHKEPLEMNSR